ncbi:hypothetical protein SY83_04750 [Paenibacillus swuensis]|uniref:Copper amine oxidase-like N-terminal domain-containing protein n=1 Tax=Paenibacillus swuensis TaxID=1178515 RepID=A0A172TFI8_9BACL|nr:stalk domain-containing protein [Paenibacillus swuensis]ANE45722.1 hypothetical protein SY83_04750 [Paenibacillus swuensis]
MARKLKVKWIVMIIISVLSLMLLSINVMNGASYLKQIQAHIINVKYVINGEERTMGDEYTSLTYNNRLYVPIRFVADTLGARTLYDNTTKEVKIANIHTQQIFNTTNRKHASSNHFEIGLFSGKNQYTRDEIPSIWSEVEYVGSGEIKIEHGYPLLSYYIKDKDGAIQHEFTAPMKMTSTFKQRDKQLRFFPESLIKNYLINRDLLLNRSSTQQEVSDFRLDPGHYVVGAEADFIISGSKETTTLQTEINITVVE